MANVYYPAILEKGEETFGIFFPDLPGCVASEETAEETLIEAEKVLAIYIEYMIEQGEELPKPTSFENIPHDPDVNEVARVLIKAQTPDEKVRVNITLDKSLISAIDKVAANRSAFISSSVRVALAAH